MNKIVFKISVLFVFFLFKINAYGQYASIEAVQGLPEGTYSFNFGNGPFNAYINSEGWMLWLQYHHQGGTNPGLSVKNIGSNLPIFDNSPLGTNLSTVPSKWGHGSQAFAASIPDSDLWLKWEAETSHHNRKIHFESPILGKFQSDTSNRFFPEITYINVHKSGHSAVLPNGAGATSMGVTGNNVLTDGPFWKFNENSWEIRSGGSRWNVDDVRDVNGNLILFEFNTIHRVWVKPIAFDSTLLIGALEDFRDHINGIKLLTAAEINQVKNIFSIYSSKLSFSSNIISLALDVIADYDQVIGPVFTTSTTINGFSKDPNVSPNLEKERAIIVLLQGALDFIFTSDTYNSYPQFINGFKFNTCTSFPGNIAPPTNPAASYNITIRANFEDPWGMNPSYDINGDNDEHAYRPTGWYLAPGSVATIIVPDSMVGKDYYIRVGAHEWDLSTKPFFKRLDRVTKKFLIDSTTIKVFNPLGGAIAIIVPYQADEGIVNISGINVLEAPFYSIKSFYTSPNFNAELSKPGPWAVFETDNVMYTVPKHSIIPGQFNLQQTLMQWDSALMAINRIGGRQKISDKHDLYMIVDELIRGGAYSIGYPMSNDQVDYSVVPGPVSFIDGPNPKYEVHFHEYGHAYAISKFPGEEEAIVNFLYIMGMNYGLNKDLNEAVKFSFVPNTLDINKTATHRLVSNTFGSARDISNTVTDEVRYQHRGYAPYFEIVNLFDWCPLQNFWLQEFFDFENGINHGINDQNTDSRIIRLCKATGADLRPLFKVFGILPLNPTAVQNELAANQIPASLTVYNRLQSYLSLIPADNTAFVNYALSVYPNLYSAGPTENPNYGVGWHYQKSLTYNTTEANNRTAILQGIITEFFPNGQPVLNTNSTLCCLPNEICDGIDNNGNGQIDEHLVNEWIGPDRGNWFEDKSYWSLCQFPNSCNTVLISNLKKVTVKSGEIGFAYNLDLTTGAQLIIENGGSVEVKE